jgi:MFS family permease
MSDRKSQLPSASSVAPKAGNASPQSLDRPRNYLKYLILVALAGWTLASYDVNLLVLALPDIARSLHISEAGLGVLGFSVYGAQFCITIWAGYAMDRFGRRRIWMYCLTGTAIFTGLTYFVQDFWQLVLVRALASGLAYAELAVSITIVNEQAPAKHRGLLYCPGWMAPRCLPCLGGLSCLWQIWMAFRLSAGRASHRGRHPRPLFCTRVGTL